MTVELSALNCITSSNTVEESAEIMQGPEAGECCEALISRYDRAISPGTHTSLVYQHKDFISRSHQPSVMEEEGTHEAPSLAEELVNN